MSDQPQTDTAAPQPTVVTLTLPTPVDGIIDPDRASGTLVIQRGDWAHMRQFEFNGSLEEISAALFAAGEKLGLIEASPPTLPAFPEPPKPAPRPTYSKPAPQPATPPEPTISIPLKKGALTVKQRHIVIMGCEAGDANYQAALQQVSKLIDGKLWDGASPIVIGDVPTLLKKMRHLTARDLSMFSLTDFVQIGVDEPPAVTAPDEPPDEEVDDEPEDAGEDDDTDDADDAEPDVPDEYE